MQSVEINSIKFLQENHRDSIESGSARVIPLSSHISPFNRYGLLFKEEYFDEKMGERYAEQLNIALATLTPLILKEVYPSAFPVGQWALTGKVKADRRYVFARDGGREQFEINLGGEVASNLPLSVSKHIKTVNVKLIRSNRYDRLEKHRDENGVRLTPSAVVFDCLSFSPLLCPPYGGDASYSYEGQRELQKSEGIDFLDLSNDFYERLYAYVVQNGVFEFDSPDKILKEWFGLYSSKSWTESFSSELKNKLSSVFDIHDEFAKKALTFSLMWYGERVAVSKSLESKIFIPEGDSLVSTLLGKYNGSGVVHPFIDNFISERRGSITAVELKNETTTLNAKGKLLRRNLGHVQLISAAHDEDFHSSFKETVLEDSISSHKNEFDIIEHGYICQMDSIAKIVSNHVQENVLSGASVVEELELAPNLSGCQPKFGANIVNTKDGLRIYPAINDVSFTHIVKPIATNNQTHGHFFPIAEWIGLRATRAAGCKTSEFGLFTYDKAVATEPEYSAEEDAIADGMSFFGSLMTNPTSALTEDWNLHGQTVLISERFDIQRKEGIKRSVGIDLCQLMGLTPFPNNQIKYASTFEIVADTIKEHCEPYGTWNEERIELLKQGVASWLIIDSDLHLKNISMLFTQDLDDSGNVVNESLRLSPAYDRVTVAGFAGSYSQKFVLSVDGKTKLNKQDWISFASNKLDLAPDFVDSMIDEMGKAVVVSVKNSVSHLISKQHSSVNRSFVANLNKYLDCLTTEIMEHISVGCGMDYEYLNSLNTKSNNDQSNLNQSVLKLTL